MKKLILIVIGCYLFSCQPESPIEEETPNPKVDFFNNLRDLCGKRFAGSVEFPEGNENRLLMTVLSCSEDEIRIPFQINDDTSRTWVLSLSDKGLLLKHDHRHEDGTPDERTDYGGWAHDGGSAYQQFFLADAVTGVMIPEGVSNQWYFQIDNEANTFTYYLERDTGPRFKAVFVMQEVLN